MVEDIANKQADTRLKLDLAKYELWKVIAVAFGAGAAVLGAAIALLGLLLRMFGH